MSESQSKRGLAGDSSSSEGKKKKPPRIFLAVHFGAGRHSKKKEGLYRKLSESACGKGLKILKREGSADDAVVEAMMILENSKKLNAGMGSYLTMNGTVEVDAGFMSGNGRFGGIGAAPGVPNPCLAAKTLADLRSDFLIPPNLLVGAGAKSWAASVGLKTCKDEDMICKKARSLYNKYLENKTVRSGHTDSDTIGCIALDADGHVAASGSTGGGLYKFAGRVGPIAQHGCGVYAQDCSGNSAIGTAIAGTGTGEYLTEIRFAQNCDSFIRQEECIVAGMTKAMDLAVVDVKERRVTSPSLQSPIVGMIGLTWSGTRGEFVVSHNSDNLVYAYGGSMFGKKVVMQYSEKSEVRDYALQVFNI